MRKRHLELIWITRRLTSLDIFALTMFHILNIQVIILIMVRNEKLIL